MAKKNSEEQHKKNYQSLIDSGVDKKWLDDELAKGKKGLAKGSFINDKDYDAFLKAGKGGYSTILDSVLANTQSQQEVAPDFEGIYAGTTLTDQQVQQILDKRPDVAKAFGTSRNKVREWWESNGKAEMPDLATEFKANEGKLEAEDYAQAEALFKPYYEEKINQSVEDLNAWMESSVTSYDRSLRSARFSLAVAGKGIGSERSMGEQEMSNDQENSIENKSREAERVVGTKNLPTGFKSVGRNLEGSITEEMIQTIKDQALTNKNQRMDRYYKDVAEYYQTPTNVNLLGNSF